MGFLCFFILREASGQYFFWAENRYFLILGCFFHRGKNFYD